jgi:RNA polymerase sigma factor (sigma-70 family)
MNYESNEHFDAFLAALRRQSPAEWSWLVGRLRARLVWWLRLKSTVHLFYLPETPAQFAEEVFEEILLKFFELFQTGTFSRYADLEALAVTIASYKLKENLARAKRERRLLNDPHWNVQNEMTEPVSYEDPKDEMLAVVMTGLQQLEPEEKNLLLRYFAGEELHEIAEIEKISPEACRKRKQRALDKLRTYVFATIKNLSVVLWPMMISGWN